MWNDLISKAVPSERDRLRRERRNGLIEIVGLSTKADASKQRLRRRQQWGKQRG
jgi:hypothetical protein